MKYELIIKEIKSGEIVCRKECDCVVGAVAGNITESSIAAGSFNYISGPVATAMSAIRGVEDAVDNVKKIIVEDFKKTTGDDITYEELAGFVEEISVRISANEEALRAVANGEVDI